MRCHATVLTLCAGSLLATVVSVSAESGISAPTMELFLQACAIPYTHAVLVEKEMQLVGFNEIAGTAASGYLAGIPGRVWLGTFKSRRYAIALYPEVGCSVIAHDGTAAEIRAEVQSWLPPPNIGIKLTTHILPPQGSLETTNYEMRGGKMQERWVVTVSTDPASQIRAILSWSRL